MNPYDHLESEKIRWYEKRNFIIDNKGCLCDHGGLHTMKSRNGKYIPGNSYNQMKEVFIKYWNMKRLLGINSSEDITDLTHHEIPESNVKCEIFTRQIWNDM